MLDSTAAVAAERQGKNARQLLEAVTLETEDQGIAVSVITVLELAHGVTRADTVARREHRQRFLDELLTGVAIQLVTVPIDLRAGEMELGYGVGTANIRHFGQIPGLKVVKL